MLPLMLATHGRRTFGGDENGRSCASGWYRGRVCPMGSQFQCVIWDAVDLRAILRYVLIVGAGVEDTKVSFWFRAHAWPSPCYIKGTVLISSCDAWHSQHSQFSTVGSDHGTLISILSPYLYFTVFPSFSSPVTHPFHSFSM